MRRHILAASSAFILLLCLACAASRSDGPTRWTPNRSTRASALVQACKRAWDGDVASIESAGGEFIGTIASDNVPRVLSMCGEHGGTHVVNNGANAVGENCSASRGRGVLGNPTGKSKCRTAYGDDQWSVYRVARDSWSALPPALRPAIAAPNSAKR